MKKTIIIFVLALFSLSFPSCSGCSGQLKEVIDETFLTSPWDEKYG